MTQGDLLHAMMTKRGIVATREDTYEIGGKIYSSKEELAVESSNFSIKTTIVSDGKTHCYKEWYDYTFDVPSLARFKML